MNDQIIQADFGGFNPRFIGISIKLNSLEAFEVWQNFFILNKTPVNEEPSLLKIATRSVLDHEVRHFHDFLLSPYSSYLLRMRVQAFLNGIQALSYIRDAEGNCLPVPISQWLQMDNTKRAAQMDDWQTLSKPDGDSEWRPVMLQTKSREELLGDAPPIIRDISQIPANVAIDSFVENAVKGYMRIGQIGEGFGDHVNYPYLHPANFFEVPALCIQAQSIWQSQGALPGAQFLEYLIDSKLGYAILFQNFFQAAMLLGKHRRPEDQQEGQYLNDIMKLSVWCLLGNYQLESTRACPTVRYERLLNHLVNDYSNPRNWMGEVAQIWDYWDSQTESVPWRLAVREQFDSNERALNSYSYIRQNWGEVFGGAVETIMGSFVASQGLMVNYLLNQPEKLVNPYFYLNSQPGEFPYPYVKIELDGFSVPLSWLKPVNARSLWTINLKEGPHSTRFVISLNNRSLDKELLSFDKKLLDAVLQFEDLMDWCDLAFSDHTMPTEVYETTRKNLEEQIKKRVLLIV